MRTIRERLLTAISRRATVRLLAVASGLIVGGLSPAMAQTEIRLTEPEPIIGVTPENSRFGLNVSSTKYLDEHKQLGIGWVRFENTKWPFTTPAAHKYAFCGSVPPWRVDMDEIIGDYHEAGIGVLPMMFQTPIWAVDVPEGVDKPNAHNYPPRDPRDYGEFCFQFAARYGQTDVPKSKLLSDDRVSGMGAIRYFEIWNEPNLNPHRGGNAPSWGPWRGSMPEFWPVFRAGAEAVKAADPKALVTSPGFAGMTPEVVDSLRTTVYPDGKRPVDFVDVINVHFYSGKWPPETAGKDPNSGDVLDVRYEEHIRRLAEWRDRYRPGAPIWLTETGHDTGGPIGISEELQAARIPRNLLIAFFNGIDRVFIYREAGSTPSKHAAAGLLRNDGSKKPGWYSMATLIRQLHGAEPAHELPTADDNVRLYTWKRDGKTLLIAWTVEGPAKLGLDLGSAKVTDAFGHVAHVENTADLIIDDWPHYLTDLADEAALAPLIAKGEKAAADRKARLAHDEKEAVYFFDFGGGDEPVSFFHGRMRETTKVPASTRYTRKAGFGFEGKALSDGFQHWFKPVYEKHYAVVPSGVAFRADAKPGTYAVEFLADASRKQERTLTLRSGGESQEIVIGRKNREPWRGKIRLTGEPFRLSGDGEFMIRYLRLTPVGADD